MSEVNWDYLEKFAEENGWTEIAKYIRYVKGED